MTTRSDRNGLEVMPLSQCLSLLRSRSIGRLAYMDAGSPVVVPVNHIVDGSSVVIRTASGGKLDAALTGRAVAFQLDDHDPARGSGWSVLVQGRADLVDEEALVGRYADELDSWALDGEASVAYVRIVPDTITGRRLHREG